jgi:hypothetical protein
LLAQQAANLLRIVIVIDDQLLATALDLVLVAIAYRATIELFAPELIVCL